MSTPVKYRIRGGTKAAMLFVAVVVDFFPLILLLVLAAIMFGHVAGACMGGGSSVGGIAGAAMQYTGCGIALAGAATTGAGMLFIGPVLYGFVAFMSKLLAYGLFTVWFGLHGHFMWAFNMKSISLNFLVFIIEMLPIIELLPAFTFLVWRHISMSRAEDKKKAAAQKKEPVESGRRRVQMGNDVAHGFTPAMRGARTQSTAARASVRYPHGVPTAPRAPLYTGTTRARPLASRTRPGAHAAAPSVREAGLALAA